MQSDLRQRLESACDDIKGESRNLQECLEKLSAALNQLEMLRCIQQRGHQQEREAEELRTEIDEKEAGLQDSIAEVLERCEMETEDFLKLLAACRA